MEKCKPPRVPLQYPGPISAEFCGAKVDAVKTHLYINAFLRAFTFPCEAFFHTSTVDDKILVFFRIVNCAVLDYVIKWFHLKSEPVIISPQSLDGVYKIRLRAPDFAWKIICSNSFHCVGGLLGGGVHFFVQVSETHVSFLKKCFPFFLVPAGVCSTGF